MIICLYDSNYPVAQNEKPKYEELPAGYFDVSQTQLSELEQADLPILLSGTYIFADNASLRPRIGEHLLAVFSHKGKRYVYTSTLSYEDHRIEVERTAFTWKARLGLSKLIKVW